MERYSNSKSIDDVQFIKYKIVVPTEQDRKDLMDAFDYLHNCDIDTDLVPVNQIVHEYVCEERTGDVGIINNIIVDENLYKKLQGEDNGKI